MKLSQPLLTISLVALTCIVIEPVSAHHDPRGVDEAKILRIEGVVAGTRWVNPHVVFWVTVGEGAEKEQWLIEAADRDSLLQDGWQQPSKGERIVFYVHPHVDPNTRYDSGDLPGWYVGAILSDGTTFGIAREAGGSET